MTDNNTQATTELQLNNTIRKLEVKLARQQAAVSETLAHIAAIRSLIDKQTPKK